MPIVPNLVNTILTVFFLRIRAPRFPQGFRRVRVKNDGKMTSVGTDGRNGCFLLPKPPPNSLTSFKKLALNQPVQEALGVIILRTNSAIMNVPPMIAPPT